MAPSRELAAAGHEVSVQVSLEAVGQLKPMLGREPHIRLDVADRIDDQRAAVPEVHEVRRVPETLIDERCDLNHCYLQVIASSSGHQQYDGRSCPRIRSASGTRLVLIGLSRFDISRERAQRIAQV